MYGEFLASSFGNYTDLLCRSLWAWSHDRSIASYAARSGHPGRCGSTCAIRFNSATRAIYSLTTQCSTSDIRISLKWYDDSGAATPTQWFPASGWSPVSTSTRSCSASGFSIFASSIQSAMAAARSITSWRCSSVSSKAVPLRSRSSDGFVVRQHEGDQSDRGPTRSTIVLSSGTDKQRRAEMPYQRLDTLPFDESEEQSGKLVHLKKFPKDHQVKLFRLVSSTGDTEWIVTNDLSETSTPQPITDSSTL